MKSQKLTAELTNLSKQARAAILSMTTLAASGHPGGSMSSIDLLLALYAVARHDPKNPQLPDRDRIVVSNGHISPAVYSALALNGYFSLDKAVSQFRLWGSIFEGHIEREVPGVEWSSGNLGQGLSAGAGMALASRINSIPYRVYVMMGDGEQQEASVWQAAMSAGHFGLDNLCAIVDRNRLQIDGRTGDVMSLEPLEDKYRSFGWHVDEVDGHDIGAIIAKLRTFPAQPDQPSILIAHTVKGKGVSFVESDFTWHGRALPPALAEQARVEILMT